MAFMKDISIGRSGDPKPDVGRSFRVTLRVHSIRDWDAVSGLFRVQTSFVRRTWSIDSNPIDSGICGVGWVSLVPMPENRLRKKLNR